MSYILPIKAIYKASTNEWSLNIDGSHENNDDDLNTLTEHLSECSQVWAEQWHCSNENIHLLEPSEIIIDAEMIETKIQAWFEDDVELVIEVDFE